MAQIENFAYTLAKINSVVIVTVTGIINHATIDSFERCRNELFSMEDFKVVVFDLSRVQTLTIDAIPVFTQFQKAIRNKGIHLSLCALPDELKMKLLKLGVIRQSELATSLKNAVLNLIKEASNGTSGIGSSEKKAA